MRVDVHLPAHLDGSRDRLEKAFVDHLPDATIVMHPSPHVSCLEAKLSESLGRERARESAQRIYKDCQFTGMRFLFKDPVVGTITNGRFALESH